MIRVHVRLHGQHWTRELRPGENEFRTQEYVGQSCPTVKETLRFFYPDGNEVFAYGTVFGPRGYTDTHAHMSIEPDTYRVYLYKRGNEWFNEKGEKTTTYELEFKQT